MGQIVLKKESSTPYSQQISRQIVAQIAAGSLKEGDKLPAERKLSETLGISRGTVRKAYDDLKKKRIIVSKMGGNHYVLGLDSDTGLRVARANEVVENMLNQLSELHMTTQEMSKLINLKLLEREGTTEKVKVGVIECRLDIMYMFKRQLSYINNMELSFFLFDEVMQSSQVANHATSCDVILTTASHYFDLCQKIPQIEPKLVEIVTTWTQHTVFELASIKEDAHIGVLYNSPRTIGLVQNALKYFEIRYSSFSAFSEHNKQFLEEFTDSQTVIIAEPMSCIFKDDGQNPLARRFEGRGGKLLRFEHNIDKGSLMIIEQVISNFWEKKHREQILDTVHS